MNLIKASVVVLALLGSLASNAQKLETRDFTATNELTARLKGTELIDENSGKRAALIKIYTPFTNESLGFDLGLFQVLGRKQAGPGEVWLYVPERTQKITVTHPKYDPVTFWLEGMEAEAGTTYSVFLNVEGREVTLVASTPNANISVDGEPVGKSPVNMHLPLGSHLVRAELGSLLFEDIVTLTRDGNTEFALKMEDENMKFGDVDIEVADGAELWFQDRREGVGSLHKHLRAGSYVVTAKRPDHEDQSTVFTVEPGTSKKVTAKAPLPHLGYLAVVTEPDQGVTVTQADSLFELLPTMQLPVSRYNLKFEKRGYYPETRRYQLTQGETLRDTVSLRKIQYVKKTTGYLAAAITLPDNPAVTFTAGGYIYNVNIEASYSLGLGRSKDVSWYDRTDNIFQGAYNYRMDEIAIRVGYQLRFAERFGVTPQVGYLIQRLQAKESDYPGDGFVQNNVSAGVRLAFHPIPHLGLFITPEYAVPMGEKGDIKEVFSQGKMTRGGFHVSVGFSVSL